MGERHEAMRAWELGAGCALALCAALMFLAGCSEILGIDPPQDRASVESGPTAEGGASGDSGDTSSAGLGGAAAGSWGGGPIDQTTPRPGGAGGDTTDSILIDGADISSCPGTDASLELAALNGRAPYQWQLIDAAPELALHQSSTNTDHATVTAASTRPGPYKVKVKVTDSARAEAVRTFTITVAGVPEIQALSLPSACPGEIYTGKLVATGGDPTRYQWTVDGLLESSGLKVDDQTLSGKVVGSASGAGHLDFTVHVSDGGACAAKPVSATIKLESPDATECLTVDDANRLAGRPLPPPCLGNPYEIPLRINGGLGPYTWAAPVLPKGLSFNASPAAITGIAEGEGTLAVRVEDAGSGRTIESTFHLAPRSSCWLAYLSKETGTTRLHFFDALLANRRTVPTDSITDEVTDFKFSPSGRYLAYRVGSPSNIRVIKLATWQEQAIDFQNVTQYAWSDDSEFLAVAYSKAGVEVLGGVDVSHEESSGPDNPYNPVPIVFPTMTTTPASVASEPVWFDGPHLAFLQPSDDDFYAATTNFENGGFDAPASQEDIAFFPGTRLKAAMNGVFVIPPSGAIAYYGTDGSETPHNNVLIAPSGLYTGRAQQGSLALFRADSISVSSKSVPDDTITGCSALLAWAPGKERIACAQQATNADDKLLMFDVDTSTDTLTQSADVLLTLPYPDSAHIARRRLFSASGTRFAFASANAFSVATIGGATATASYNAALNFSGLAGNNDSAEFSFAPNEQLLLHHRGNRLSLFDVLGAQTEVLLSDDLAPSVACVEDFRDADAGWCGTERPAQPFKWAPGSDLAAYRNALGQLEVYDFSWRQAGAYVEIHVNEQCAQGCILDPFAFQP